MLNTVNLIISSRARNTRCW